MFNSFLKRYGSSPYLLILIPILSYSDVLDLSLLQSHLSSERSLTLILLDNSLDSVIYLSFASSNHVSFLIDSSLPLSQLIHLIDLISLIML